jgi:hypothetical protein
MNIDTLITNLNLNYYQSLQLAIGKSNCEWLNEIICELKRLNLMQVAPDSESINMNDYSQTQIQKSREPQQTQQTILSTASSNHNHIFSDDKFYKRPWVKLNPIHKILKIKEFVNNLKIHSEQDRIELRDELILLVKDKKLTKPDHINYDEVSGKIISLTNLQYKNNKYYYGSDN